MPRRQVQDRAVRFDLLRLKSPLDDLLRPGANVQARTTRRGWVVTPVNDQHRTAGTHHARRFGEELNRLFPVENVEQQTGILTRWRDAETIGQRVALFAVEIGDAGLACALCCPRVPSMSQVVRVPAIR